MGLDILYQMWNFEAVLKDIVNYLKAGKILNKINKT